MKNISLALVLGLFISPSCTFYKSVVVSNPSPEAVKEIASFKPSPTIQNKSNLPVRILELELAEEGIKGTKGPSDVRFHKPKNGSFLKSRNKEALNYVHYYSESHSLDGEDLKIPFDDINGLMYHEVDWGASVLASVGLTAGLTVGVSTVLLIIACNCPYVDIIDENGESHFQGTMFPGAIFESLERTDRLVMDMNPNGEQVHIRISNALPEREYINEVKLFRYEVQEHERLAINNKGELVAVSNLLPPTIAMDNGGGRWDSELGLDDNVVFGFDNSPSREEFNRIDLQFPIPEKKEDFNLVINAKQTEWLENVANNSFKLFGTQFDEWVSKNDKKEREGFGIKAAERGLLLRVLAKVDGEYQLVTWFNNAGTKSFRDMIVSLPSNLNYGDQLDLRLESAYRFWEIDQVVMARNVRAAVDYEELPLLSAITNEGKEAAASLSKVDKDYTEILNEGDFMDLKFMNTLPQPGVQTKLVLKGTGYYHHERNYTNKPNIKALKQLKKPMSTHQLSQILDLAQSLAKK